MKERVSLDLETARPNRARHDTEPDGTPDLAPKIWVSMMAFARPILALGCSLQHRTARNILERKEFVINVPGVELAKAVWKSSELPHPRPVEAAGSTPIPAIKVKPPRIAECRAHLECILDRHLVHGDEVVLLGQIVDVSVDEEACQARDLYEYLRMLVYLEDATYGVVDRARQIGHCRESRIYRTRGG